MWASLRAPCIYARQTVYGLVRLNKASLEDSPLISQKHTQGKHLFRRWPTSVFPYQDFEAQLDVFKRVQEIERVGNTPNDALQDVYAWVS